MDLLQLHYFMTIADCQNMTQAADRLHVAQPSLSKNLSRLEKELGTQLFDRRGRKIVLNAYGRMVLDRAHNIFRELDNLQAEIDIALDRQARTVAIASMDSIYVRRWLPQFIAAHQDIIVRHSVNPTAALEKLLEDGKIDFAITDARQIPDYCQSIDMGSDEYLILAPKASPISEDEPQYFSAFRDQPFISSSKTGDVLRPIDILSQSIGIQPNIIFEGDQNLTSKLLDMGYGCVIISKAQISIPDYWDSCKEKFKIIPLRDPIAHFTIRLIWDDHRVLSPAAEDFINYVQTRLDQFDLRTPS